MTHYKVTAVIEADGMADILSKVAWDHRLEEWRDDYRELHIEEVFEDGRG